MLRKWLAIFLMFVVAPAFAQYQPYALHMMQADSSGTFFWGRYFVPPNPTSDYILGYDGVTSQPKMFALGSLGWNGTNLTLPTQVNADWGASSGAAQILNKPTIPTAPSQSSATRSLNSAFQISTSRNALALYSVQCMITASIAGGQQCDVILEIASDSGFTVNVQTLSIIGTGQTYTLAIALQGIQPQTAVLSGFVPVGYYVRLRTVNVTGTPSFTYRAGQEVLL